MGTTRLRRFFSSSSILLLSQKSNNAVKLNNEFQQQQQKRFLLRRRRRHTSSNSNSNSNNNNNRNNLLPRPTILHSSNHLLVVNKPAGWRSVPNLSNLQQKDNTNDHNHNIDDPKCMLSYLKRHKYGGGSTQHFLNPLHRLDQPCTGIIIYGKTSRISSRIQSNWNSAVKKQYVVVLESSSNAPRLDLLRQYSEEEDDKDDNEDETADSTTTNTRWMKLQGYHPKKLRRKYKSRNRHRNRRSSRHRTDENNSNSGRGWSVTMIPKKKEIDDEGNYRLCTIRWKQLLLLPSTTIKSSSNGKNQKNDAVVVLLIETKDGARHLVRSILAMVNCPIAGDVRYYGNGGGGNAGNNRDNKLRAALPDRSVALHARRIVLPNKIRLGGGGNNNNIIRREFVAPIPLTWEQYFNLSEKDIIIEK